MANTQITSSFANERILRAIRSLPDKRARLGLAKLDGRLARENVPPALRLHVIAAFRQLAVDSAATRHDRYLHAAASNPEEGE